MLKRGTMRWWQAWHIYTLSIDTCAALLSLITAESKGGVTTLGWEKPTCEHWVRHVQQTLIDTDSHVFHGCSKPRMAEDSSNVNAVPWINLQHSIQQIEPSPGRQQKDLSIIGLTMHLHAARKSGQAQTVCLRIPRACLSQLEYGYQARKTCY